MKISTVLSIILFASIITYSQVSNGEQTFTQEQYIDIMNKALDGIIIHCQKQPQQKLNFAANLFFAHESCIKNMPLETLKKYVEALKDAGVSRIDINMGQFPWLDNDQSTIQKYDALIGYIRHLKLQIAINPQYGPTHHRVQNLAEWKNRALQIYPEIARRYSPEIFIVIHEPTTMASRMRFEVSPKEWGNFVKETVKVVKSASPKTRCGAGVLADPVFLQSEQKCFDEFVSLDELEILTIDIYNARSFKSANDMIRQAKAKGKNIYIEETWRPPYYVPQAGRTESIDAISAKGIGNEIFQGLDIKWLEALSLYASVWGLEAVTPFWTQTFFKYVADEKHDSALDPVYNLQVIKAINNGERTKTFKAFKEIIQKRGIVQTAVKLQVKIPQYTDLYTVKKDTILAENAVGPSWIAWKSPSLPGADLVYVDRENWNLWVMDEMGGNKKCITGYNDNVLGVNFPLDEDGKFTQVHWKGDPEAHPTQPIILFKAENENSSHKDLQNSPSIGWDNDIWALNVSTRRYSRLTNLAPGQGIQHTAISEDGKWYVYPLRYDKGNAVKNFGYVKMVFNELIIDINGDAHLIKLFEVEPNGQMYYEPNDIHCQEYGSYSLFYVAGTGNMLDPYRYDWTYKDGRYIGKNKALQYTPSLHEEFLMVSPSGRKIAWMRGPVGGLLVAYHADLHVSNPDFTEIERVTWYNDFKAWPDSCKPKGSQLSRLEWKGDGTAIFFGLWIHGGLLQPFQKTELHRIDFTEE